MREAPAAMQAAPATQEMTAPPPREPAPAPVATEAAPAAMMQAPASMAPGPWLARIRQLKKEGRQAEAKQALAAFSKRYPAYPIPDDLRDLR